MERINPAVKTVMLLILGLALSFCNRLLISGGILLLAFLMLLCSDAPKKKVLMAYSGALLAAASLFFTSYWFGKGESVLAQASADFALTIASSHSVYSGLILAVRILSYAGIGLLFAFTTDSDELVSSFIHQLKLPPKYAYGILAAFHFVGNVREEYRKVNLAFQVRGIRLGVFSFQQLFVMLVNALHWSGDIAAAMESKGFDGTGNRTYYRVSSIGRKDMIFMAITMFLTLLCFVGNL